MKLLMAKINKKKVQTKEVDTDDQEESADVSGDKDLLDSDNEESSESSNECLRIDTYEEICIKV